LYTF